MRKYKFKNKKRPTEQAALKVFSTNTITTNPIFMN